jgi:hypothetical protein
MKGGGRFSVHTTRKMAWDRLLRSFTLVACVVRVTVANSGHVFVSLYCIKAHSTALAMSQYFEQGALALGCQ